MLIFLVSLAVIIVIGAIIFILKNQKGDSNVFAETGVNLVLEFLKNTIFNKELNGIGKISKIYFKNKNLIAILTINGLTGKKFFVTC